MSLENRRQLENTRTKLQELEQLYTKMQHSSATNAHVRELTLHSLKKRINQFKEEIARFEARVRSPIGEASTASDRKDCSHPH
jgi:septation ring formation regulator EzrA